MRRSRQMIMMQQPWGPQDASKTFSKYKLSEEYKNAARRPLWVLCCAEERTIALRKNVYSTAQTSEITSQSSLSLPFDVPLSYLRTSRLAFIAHTNFIRIHFSSFGWFYESIKCELTHKSLPAASDASSLKMKFHRSSARIWYMLTFLFAAFSIPWLCLCQLFTFIHECFHHESHLSNVLYDILQQRFAVSSFWCVQNLHLNKELHIQWWMGEESH